MVFKIICTLDKQLNIIQILGRSIMSCTSSLGLHNASKMLMLNTYYIAIDGNYIAMIIDFLCSPSSR